MSDNEQKAEAFEEHWQSLLTGAGIAEDDHQRELAETCKGMCRRFYLMGRDDERQNAE